MARRNYIIDQNTCQFRAAALLSAGWEDYSYTWGRANYVGYRKRWHIQNEEGGAHWIEVALREHENIALVYVNNQWVGRALTINEADAIAKALKKNAK